MLTDKRIAEILGRADAAMPGDWKFDGELHIYGPDGYCQSCLVRALQSCIACPTSLTKYSPEKIAANGYFIAHARADVPGLLADLAEAKNRIREMEQIEMRRLA